MNKKALSLVVLALPLCASLLTGCKSTEPTVTTPEDVQIDYSQPKSIVHTALPETVTMFEELPIGACYGLCDGYRFPVTSTVLKPNGDILSNQKSVRADIEGTYVVTLKSTIGKETITEIVNVNASGYSPKSLFTFNQSSFVGENAAISPYVTKYTANTGLKMAISSDNSSITYKNVVDLKTVHGNLIEFTGNPDSNLLKLCKIKVVLTDAYDSNKSIGVVYEINGAARLGDKYWDHGNMNTFATVEYKGVAVGDSSKYPPLQNQTVLWDQCLWTDYPGTEQGEYVPCSFIYDYADNAVKACAQRTTWNNPSEYLLIRDLDNPKDDYADFPGWTTGEVFVSIEAQGTAGEIIVTKIGNKTFDSTSADDFKQNTGNALINGYDLASMPKGAVGYYYPLPDYSKSNNGMEAHLYYKNGESLSEVSNVNWNNFYPDKAGTYVIKFKSVNEFGCVDEKEGAFEILTEPVSINDDSAYSFSATLFEKTTVPSFSYSGGCGALKKEVQLIVGSEIRSVTEGEVFTIDKKASVNKFRVAVTDDVGYVRSFEYDISVNNNVTIFRLVDSFDNVSIVKDSYFKIPDYVAIDYSKENVASTNLPIIIKRGKTQVYNVGDQVQISSDTNFTYCYGSEVLGTLQVRVVPSDVSVEEGNANIGEYFKNNTNISNIVTTEAGLALSMSGASKVSMPYPLSTTNLNLSFSVFAGAKYDSVKMSLRSLNGHSLELEVKGVGSNKTPVLYVNGLETSIGVEVSHSNYTGTEFPGLLGAVYYTYSIAVDSGRKCFMNASSVKLGDIDKWDNGNAFDGFKKACADVTFSVEGAYSGDILLLNAVSNQSLNRAGLSFGDLCSPAVAFEGVMESKIVERGENVCVRKAYAYDFFSGSANVKVSVMDPEANSIYRDVKSEDFYLTCDYYGSYFISYKFMDYLGNGGSVGCIFMVNDNEAPVITINGSYKETYRSNEKIKVLSASVRDNYDEEPILTISIKDHTGELKAVEAGQKLSLKAGKYTIVYYAFDSTGNSSHVEFTFEVK